MAQLIPDWTSVISSAVVPVVIISACGLLALAFQNRLGLVMSFLRKIHRERLHEYRDILHQKRDIVSDHHLHFLERQTALILRRVRLLRFCLLFLISSISSLLLCSLLIGISFLTQTLDLAVIFFFILGLLLAFLGLIYAFFEIWLSLASIERESDFVQELLKDDFPSSS